jgi:hypothetical protein
MSAVTTETNGKAHHHWRFGVTSKPMPRSPDKIPENVDFAAQELLDAPADQRSAMLENIAKALARRLLQDNPGIGAREVSERVREFLNAVRALIE